ncbi:flagellar basal body rod protein FlgB [Trinickia mobilis]|uniref:flagellar basal body rod protein FlgB n=1 Tax=Trinickia mobilis TaxID=2816356 RepID=UPI001A8C2915|nr:flagellar basal body rod protein FlgB [Trinickia mobilis]
MGIHLNQALGVHPQALELRVERSKVLASNLANETTPGYQARDLDFKAALQHEMSTAQAGSLGDLGGEQPDLLYRLPNQPSIDGNTVELGVEQAAFAQNAADFQMGLTFLTAKFKGLNMAINGNG